MIRAKLQEVHLAKIEGWVIFEDRKLTSGDPRCREHGEHGLVGGSYALGLSPVCREV